MCQHDSDLIDARKKPDVVLAVSVLATDYLKVYDQTVGRCRETWGDVKIAEEIFANFKETTFFRDWGNNAVAFSDIDLDALFKIYQSGEYTRAEACFALVMFGNCLKQALLLDDTDDVNNFLSNNLSLIANEKWDALEKRLLKPAFTNRQDAMLRLSPLMKLKELAKYLPKNVLRKYIEAVQLGKI